MPAYQENPKFSRKRMFFGIKKQEWVYEYLKISEKIDGKWDSNRNL